MLPRASATDRRLRGRRARARMLRAWNRDSVVSYTSFGTVPPPLARCAGSPIRYAVKRASSRAATASGSPCGGRRERGRPEDRDAARIRGGGGLEAGRGEGVGRVIDGWVAGAPVERLADSAR